MPELQPPTHTDTRIQSVDALRGAIIIIMALDHVRDYTSAAAMSFSPTDLSRTTAALFFTRWITHFCAPVFAFTAGIGAFFWFQHGHTKSQLSRFLLSRGLWLVFLEITVVRFILFFQWQFHGAVIILLVFLDARPVHVRAGRADPLAGKNSRAAQPAGHRYAQPV